jgi:hypothetical protein
MPNLEKYFKDEYYLQYKKICEEGNKKPKSYEDFRAASLRHLDIVYGKSKSEIENYLSQQIKKYIQGE